MVVVRTIFIMAILFVFLAPSARADSYGLVADGWEEHIRRAVFKIADTRFDEGLELLEEYIEANPKSASGYFFYAAALQEKIQKMNDFSLMPKFRKYANRSQMLAKYEIRQGRNVSVSRLFLAATDGYVGMLAARQRNLLTAFKNGIEARRGLEKVIKERPEIPDTYFGLGMIYYFSSKKGAEEGGMVAWIIRKFITGGRDMHAEGIEMLNKSIDENALSADYARSALMWIYLYDHQYAKAKKLAREVANKFQHDSLSRWVQGRVALVEGRCDDAREMFNKVHTLNIEGLKLPESDFPELPVALKKADVCAEMEKGNYIHAYKLNREILKWLKSKPKITLEYQDEKNLLKEWLEESQQLDERLEFSK